VKARRCATLAVTVAVVLCGTPVFAQGYPAKPVRMIVPLVPGGSTDALARVLAQKMSESMGQQIVVDNRGGASGNIGTELVARAAPDGYTIMAVSMTIVVNPFLFPKVGFDPVKDFAPISLVGAAPLVLIAHPSLPVKSVQDLIALARKAPGKLNYPSAGKGTNSHLSMELFKSLSRVNIVHVPYRGGGLAQTAILGGEVHVGFSNAISVVSHVKTSKVRALGTSSPRRSSLLPDVPTIAEAGVPGYSFTTWYGVVAPARTPAPLIGLLNDHVVNAARSADVAERFAHEGAELIASSPPQFGAHIKSELERWSKVIKEADGLRAD
jgi:tripartite-type tricarboxylate transporter receptor subunit TctC